MWKKSLSGHISVVFFYRVQVQTSYDSVNGLFPYCKSNVTNTLYSC